MFRENHPCAQPRPIGSVAAFSDSIETVAGRHNPRIGRGPFQILAVILKHGRVFWWQRREIIDGLVSAGGKACSRDVMSKNAAVHYLGKKRRTRNQIAQHVGNILLAFRSEGLLIAGTSAEGDHDDLLFLGNYRSPS